MSRWFDNPRGYRMWIYGFNVLFLMLLIVFIICAVQAVTAEKMYFFPMLSLENEPGLVYMFVATAVQIITVIIGSLGVFCTHRWTLRVYWIGMLLLLIADVVIGIVWVFKFRNIHATYRSTLKDFWTDAGWKHGNGTLSFNDTVFCGKWNDVQRNFQCCGVNFKYNWSSVNWFCNEEISQSLLPASCCAESVPCISSSPDKYDRGCDLQLLDWLGHASDTLFIVGYAILFSFKCIYILILRSEMEELLLEIFHGQNAHFLQSSWVAPDLDVVDKIGQSPAAAGNTTTSYNTVTSCPGDITQRKGIMKYGYVELERPESAPQIDVEAEENEKGRVAAESRVRFQVTKVGFEKKISLP